MTNEDFPTLLNRYAWRDMASCPDDLSDVELLSLAEFVTQDCQKPNADFAVYPASIPTPKHYRPPCAWRKRTGTDEECP